MPAAYGEIGGVRRNSLQFAALRNDDIGIEDFLFKAKIIGQRLYVGSVLPDGVIKPLFGVGVEGHGPVLLVDRAEYPARVVLGLDDKDAFFHAA